MTTRQLKKLNHYKDFQTDQGINNIMHFVENQQYPAGLNTRQKLAYSRKYGQNSGFVFERRNQSEVLYYRPQLPNREPNEAINLEVVKPSQRTQKMQEIYDDIRKGLGTGLTAFYHQVAMKYLNIRKQDSNAFLKKQGDYLVGVIPKKKVSKPIIASAPNQRWGVDLIDMNAYLPAKPRNNRPRPANANNNMQYIFTCVDYFSGKVFAKAIPNRANGRDHPDPNNQIENEDTLSDALDHIINNESHTTPRIIQADSEFCQGSFKQRCAQRNITLIKTTSYTPTSNGKVERANREIRKKIKALLVRRNNLTWVQHLPALIENINHQQSSKNHMTPDQLWRQGHQAPPRNQVVPLQPPALEDNMNQQERRLYNQAVEDKRARDLVRIGRIQVFQPNDLVRVKLLTFSKNMRKVQKGKIGWNLIAVHYTPKIYKVVRAYRHPRQNIADEYTLREYNPHGNEPMVTYHGNVNGEPKKFTGAELQKVPTPAANHIAISTHIAPRTTARADFINRIPGHRSWNQQPPFNWNAP
ncbi:MAG: transposase [Alphaproteobacteria bacterium]|nr:transposase [Alphaproteobacteria bacterium]